ncbi:MAG: helix-turn-helix domain-containing protein [Candidatus Omnitrophota bacterium]|nr:helix-turn-helix domain-containing protein [Candidatus Omnitrophota bacterium]MDZ4243137.1 helix-turn-helix domain-containing protein [Candidatus Omnitrophota bacterium]
MTTSSQYISLRESAQLLGISEKKVMDLIDEGQLKAYRIADQFLRLKKGEVMDLRNTGTVENEAVEHPYTARDRARDFFYFNDFYLAALAVILVLLYIIVRID